MQFQNVVTSLFVGIFTILIMIRYHPFHSAIEKYLTFRKCKNNSNSSNSSYSAVESSAAQTEAHNTDSEASTVQEATEEEKEENKENSLSSQEAGQPKNESEYFDMLPDPNA